MPVKSTFTVHIPTSGAATTITTITTIKITTTTSKVLIPTGKE